MRGRDIGGGRGKTEQDKLMDYDFNKDFFKV